MKTLVLILVLIFLVSCSTDDSITTDGFEPISEQYPFEDLEPEVETDYWELKYAVVHGQDDVDEEIIVRNGALCHSAEDDLCQEEFRNLKPEFGFAAGCLPASCFYYLKYQADDENHLVTTKDELLQFLGTINTQEEALLWTRANAYYFRVNDIDGGAIKTAETGFELIVLKTVSYCTPIQTNIYHLKVQVNGEIKVLNEKVFSVDENSCV